MGKKFDSPCFFAFTVMVAFDGIYPFKSIFPEIMVWFAGAPSVGGVSAGAASVETIRSVSLSAGAVTARIRDSATDFPMDLTTALSSYVVPFSAVGQLQPTPSPTAFTVAAILNAASPICRS
ncbi:TPA: hypothetical protein DIS60_00295 [Patescibacteria group bacterium]|nr:hypothetical protein [Patescibacteria group bacterium]